MSFNNSQLPPWVQYIAQDEDGQWWGYQAEPNQSHNGWYENEVGQIVRLHRDTPCKEWFHTLQKVKK